MSGSESESESEERDMMGFEACERVRRSLCGLRRLWGGEPAGICARESRDVERWRGGGVDLVWLCVVSCHPQTIDSIVHVLMYWGRVRD